MAPIPPAIRALAGEAAKGIGRAPGDAEPFARILADNWFDSPDSVAACKPEELAALGVPLRFAQQLVTLASGGGAGGRGLAAPALRRAGPSTSSQALPAPPKPQQPMRREGNNATRRLKVRDMDPAFRARGGILGTKGRNLHHIQDESKVKVDLRGDGQSEPMELIFSEPPSNAAMEHAMRMAKSLLGTIYDDYARWQKERSGGGGAGGATRTGGERGRQTRERIEQSDFRHTIDIAECEPAFAARARLLGTKGKNIRDIEAKTGAAVQLQGDSGEAMRIEIGAENADQLLQAQDQAEDLVSKVYSDYDEWLANGGAEAEERGKGQGGTKRKASDKPGGGEFNESLELQECDPGFTLRGKLLGSKGSRLRKIEEETGAAVHLAGDRSGEPTHLEISAVSQNVLDAAVRMGGELIEDVYDSYAQWLADGGAAAGGGHGGGKQRGRGQDTGRMGKGGAAKGASKGEGMALRKVLKLKDCDAAFDLRNKIKGTKCVNLHHIQDETGAQIWVTGDRSDPVRLEIAANDQGVFDRGLQMAKDLIKNVFKDYEAWLANRGGEPAAKRFRPAAAAAA